MSGAAAKRQMRRQLQGRGLGGAGAAALGLGALHSASLPGGSSPDDSPSPPARIFQKSKTSSARSWGGDRALGGGTTTASPGEPSAPTPPRDPKVCSTAVLRQRALFCDSCHGP